MRNVPNMTKRHFEMLAAIISAECANARSIIPQTAANEAETTARLAACANIANALADKCAQSAPIYDLNGNRRFDRERFLAACKL